jgi:hypothetical protein
MNKSLQRYSEYEYHGYYLNGFLKYIVNDTYCCQCFIHTEELDTEVYISDIHFCIINNFTGNKLVQMTEMTEPFTEIQTEIIRKFFPNMTNLIDLNQQRDDIVKALTIKIFQRVIDRFNYQVLSCILPEDIIEMLVTINNP